MKKYCFFIALRKLTLILLITFLLPACSAWQTRNGMIMAIPDTAGSRKLDDVPFNEYWMGIRFNDAKVGFTHTTIEKLSPATFRIRSATYFQLRFLGTDKKVSLQSSDIVDNTLRLKSFSYDYVIDDSQLSIKGHIKNNQLSTQIKNSSQTINKTIDLTQPVYPTSAITLYPLIHGLSKNQHYIFTVYNGETQQVLLINQHVSDLENNALFSAKTYRLITNMAGQKTTTWLNQNGLPIYQQNLSGILTATLEDEKTALSYLRSAAFNKQDVLLDFSLIRLKQPMAQARHRKHLRVAIKGFSAAIALTNDQRQRCVRKGDRVICDMTRRSLENANKKMLAPSPSSLSKYLGSSLTVPTKHPAIKNKAAEITQGHDHDGAKIKALLNWLQNNIQQSAIDSFSALDVLDRKIAECQGFAYLYTAFARSLDIPTRVVNGIVYSAKHQGFLYHTWTESLINQQWLIIDPILNQFEADVSHIKFLEGENHADLLPLLDMLGNIDIEILDNKNSAQQTRPL